MHNCIICSQDCDCHYVGNEEFEGDDFICTGCHNCEDDLKQNGQKEADDFGSTDYMAPVTKSHCQTLIL